MAGTVDRLSQCNYNFVVTHFTEILSWVSQENG